MALTKFSFVLASGISLLLLPASAVLAQTGSQAGLEITDMYVRAPFDKVPRFCNVPNVPSVTVNLKSGNWSDPSVWPGNQLPGANAHVQIAPNTTVTYDVQSDARLDCIEVEQGADLVFSTTQNTRLYINELMVMPESGLTIGTQANPMPADKTTEIIWNDSPLKTGTVVAPGIDPQQYGKGLINFGDLTIYGAKKDPTFVRTVGDLHAGQTQITLAQALTGWRAGDKLVLPDTRYLSDADVTTGYKDGGLNNRIRKEKDWEEITLQSVSGNTITLASPLHYGHPCARDADGQNFADRTITVLPNGEKLCGHVGNLTRNVTFRSENPNGVRGHSIYLHRANVNVNYAAFTDMGRTTFELLDSAIFDANAHLTHLGTNQIGRYSFHLHHLWGVTPANPGGWQAQVVGIVINGGLKWGMTVHDSHYGLIKDNIVYNIKGAAIVTEDGSESFNTFDHNFTVATEGIPVLAPSDTLAGIHDENRYDTLGRKGSGFWFRGPHNYVKNNVSASTVEGFGFYTESLGGNIGNNGTIVKIPISPGANLQQDGQYTSREVASLPVLEFAGNESYSTAGIAAIGFWQQRVSGQQAYTNTVIWHANTALLLDYAGGTMDGLIVRGSGGQGVGVRTHNPAHPILRHVDMQGVEFAHKLDDRPGSGFLWDDSYVRAIYGIYIPRQIQDSFGVQNVVISNVKFEPLPGHPLQSIVFGKPGYSHPSFYLHKEAVTVYNYQQQPGSNFRIFRPDQAPDVPAPFFTGGCPEQLSNQECWGKYGIASMNEVATCIDTTSHIEITESAYDGGAPYAPMITCPLANSNIPRLIISQPTAASSLVSGNVVVEYATSGDLSENAVDHVVLTLDSGPFGLTAPLKGGTYTITNVFKGLHILSGYLAKVDGTKVIGTDALTSFTVTAASPTDPPPSIVPSPSVIPSPLLSPSPSPQPSNKPPVITFDHDTTNLTATAGQTFTLEVTATDDDGDTVSLTADSLPPGATFE